MQQLSVSKLLEGLPQGGMSEADEIALTKQLAKSRTEEGRMALVTGHLRDAFFYARQCCHSRLEDDEILSLCFAALERASTRHHYKRGRFFPYAKPYIRGAIYRKWRSMDAVRGAGRTETLSAPDNVNGEPDVEPMDSEDMIAEPEFEVMDLKEKWELVKPLLAKLSDSERRVIELHYSGGMNFREIADLMGVTRSATQGTHTRALRKVRNALLRQRRLYE